MYFGLIVPAYSFGNLFQLSIGYVPPANRTKQFISPLPSFKVSVIAASARSSSPYLRTPVPSS